MKRELRRITLILTLALMLISLLAPAVFAVQGDAAYDATLPRYIDASGYLSAEEAEAVNARCVEIADKYGVDVVIDIVDTCGNYTHMEYADDTFDYEGYGYGENRDGVLLLVCMNPECRGMWISTRGVAIDYYWLEDIDILMGYITEPLRNADYFGAFNTYLDVTDRFLADCVAEGVHYWTQEEEDLYASDELQSGGDDEEAGLMGNIIFGCISVGLGITVGVLVIMWLRGAMLTGVEAEEAQHYLKKDTFDLRVK